MQYGTLVRTCLAANRACLAAIYKCVTSGYRNVSLLVYCMCPIVICVFFSFTLSYGDFLTWVSEMVVVIFIILDIFTCARVSGNGFVVLFRARRYAEVDCKSIHSLNIVRSYTCAENLHPLKSESKQHK